MSQGKKKSGKPGNAPSRNRQHADRSGKFAPDHGSGKPRVEGRGKRSGTPRQSAPETPRHRAEGDIKGSFRSRSSPAGGRESERHGGRAENRPDSGFARELREGNFPRDTKGTGPYWLFGQHPVTEAIANPLRKIQRLVRVGGAEGDLPDTRSTERPLPPWEPIDRHQLEMLLPEGAVHQGIAARVAPLPEPDLLDICDQAAGRDEAVVVILDQVTDPHNVGAILRSAAAFGAVAVILTERHAAPESGTLAKSASGALEHVPLVRVGNLARAMEQLKEAGFWLAGLAAEGKTSLAGAKLSGKVGLVMGAEGSGLRRLTREHCDLLVRLPTSGAISHLNVSNAAAVALYELARLRG